MLICAMRESSTHAKGALKLAESPNEMAHFSGFDAELLNFQPNESEVLIPQFQQALLRDHVAFTCELVALPLFSSHSNQAIASPSDWMICI